MYKGNELVSVVMTTYNRECTLLNSINSVLNQTYANIQFIIVDDCSTDNTNKILSGIADPRVEIITLPENRHIAYATDKGFEHIKGDFVALIDSDDQWKPNKLEVQLEYMKSHPEHQGCFTWMDAIDEKGNDQNEKYFIYKCMFSSHTDTREEWLRFFFFKGNKLVNPSSLVTTQAAKAIGKHNSFMTQAPDLDWWVRFTKKFSFGVIEEPLVKVCISDDNESGYSAADNSRKIRFYNELMQIRYRFFDDMDRDLFISTFKDDFVCKDSYTDDELKCEQAFLMLRPFENCHANSALALLKFEELMNDPVTEELLWTKYKFGTRQAAKYTGKNLYFDHFAEEAYNEAPKLKEENDNLKILRRKTEEKCKQKLYSMEVVSSIVKSNNKLLDDYSKSLNKKLKEANEEIKRLNSINSNLNVEYKKVIESLNTVVNSSAWRITAPLRNFKDRKKK